MTLIVICCLAVVQRSVIFVALINFDLSHPDLALLKTASLARFCSSATCNLATCAVVSPSKNACSALSPAPPSPVSTNAATAGIFGVE